MVRHAFLKHCNLFYVFAVITIYILLGKKPLKNLLIRSVEVEVYFLAEIMVR